MGCHTWIYTKVNNVLPDEVMLKYYNKTIYQSDKLYYGIWDLRYFDQWYTETNYKGQPDNKSKVLDIRKVPDEIKHLFRLNDTFFEMPDSESYLIFDNTGLYIDSGYHNIIRVYNYPEILLHSYKECEDFINSGLVFSDSGLTEEQIKNLKYNNENRYMINGTKENALKILRQFYEEHPETLIKFG